MSSPRLRNLAYGMLGSVADAEDVLQDAELKLLQLPDPPDNPEAFMFRVVTNLSLDRLRILKRQRVDYPGPWLPEPLATESPDAEFEMAEQLSLGFVLMLERLTPAQRVVFVLRQAFDYSFAEIADIVGITEANARQRFRRARAELQGARRFATPAAEQRQLLEDLLSALQSGNAENVVDLLSDEAVALSDGGGVVSAAIIPITDPARIAQVTVFLAQKAAGEGPLEYSFCQLNMGIGLLVRQDGELHTCILVDGADGRIEHLYVIRNPAKLARLAELGGGVVT